ncbi:beta-1,4 N-acetylgalactosaminyltransferase 1a isoform X1 [Phyllopteryx taeniolatus]|uniref:beta-1,4 N-acetylgalactosaminyltransferase 1a isoform X1 n=2 Tax=Phyllopteryx taeniolatus TaxID=161469 RepID=UPI002AD4E4D4|nr:beta-1,4 N-acetylgalactosaminyltransferase 1a isoform X1 [Phyllopteryx taeniolatus]
MVWCRRNWAATKMRITYKKCLGLLVISGFMLVALLNSWSPGGGSGVDLWPGRTIEMELVIREKIQDIFNDYNNISYHIKKDVACRLATNTCVCVADKETFRLPFSKLLFPRVKAHNLDMKFLQSHPDPEGVKRHRDQEYKSIQMRSSSPADMLIVNEANSPLQFPSQGVAVRPLNTIIIPGLGLIEEATSNHTVYLTSTLGTFDVAATVDKVSVKGEGKMHMSLSSASLSALNRQLQFLTYTNTVFHPRTADTVQFATEGHRSFFTIKIGHSAVPRLYNTGFPKENNISTFVTIVTKTFLRYGKLKDLIDSIRQYYPTITIVIADDNEQPQPVTGPHIEQFIMPFGKGWFAGRNLAVSQVTTKYVLWVDDDFLFNADTKLEKMVDILERTGLDLVGGAVRELTGWTSTFRHTISVETGGEDGDCIHIRRGYHHAIEGFPNCVVADAVINFFMGRTDKVQQVGFNPRLARRGHLEFFIDGLGSLHIGSCSDVIINHASKIKLPWSGTKSEKAYKRFRYSNSNDENHIHDEVFYFTNRFKCMTRHE